MILDGQSCMKATVMSGETQAPPFRLMKLKSSKYTQEQLWLRVRVCVCWYVCFISAHFGVVCFLCMSVMGTVCLLRSCLPILSQLKGNKAALTGL